MRIIYENKVKAEGVCVHEFEEEKILIIFGDDVPEGLADYCYIVSVTPIYGEIKPGQTFKADDLELKITAVGWAVPEILSGLGHCIFKFNGASDEDLPGTICVEEHDLPNIGVGSVIQILE